MTRERWVRILLAAGFAVSGYLLWLHYSGQTSSLVGCGTDSGCSDVLGSRWSQVFGIPVSLLAAALYLNLLFMPERPVRVVGGWVLIVAALWFIGLQLFVVQSICPWCMSLHAIGLSAGGLLVWKKRVFQPAFIALAAGTLLAVTQIFGPAPETHAITRSYIEGNVMIVPEELPILGDPSAEHILVEYFDYTCNSCRDLHGDLKKLREAVGDSIAVVCKPTPLERACNAKLRPKVRDHPHACALSKLSLAAWRANPEQWPRVHDLLFARPVMEPAVARVEVEKITGVLNFEDPWIDAQIQENADALHLLSATKVVMPKLLLGGNSVMHGLAKDAETFVATVRKELDL